MKLRCFFLVGLLSTSGWTHAEQGCATGFFPGGTQPNGPICVPIPGYGTTNNTTSSLQPNRYWQLTWGAIAMDVVTGATGTTVGHSSRGKARRDAVARCASVGGRNCKVVLAYKNQCAVIVDPVVENGETVAGISISQSAPSIEVASQLALSSCSVKNGGRECKVVYSDCTNPLLVRD